MDRVFILHGWAGSPEGNWFPWLKEKLESRKIEVHVPRFPNPDHPDMNAWFAKLNETVGKPDDRCFFIGHSLGCITILRYLERLGDGERIGGVVLVAGFTDDLGIKELGNFYKTPIAWDRIRETCKRFVVVASDNDSYVDLRYGNELKEKLGAEEIIEHGMGHFSMKELHVALNELLKMM